MAGNVQKYPGKGPPATAYRPQDQHLGRIQAGIRGTQSEVFLPGLGATEPALEEPNDSWFPPEHSARFFAELQKAKVPSEIRFFQSGWHGFNIGKTKGTESMWPEVFGVWLRQNRFSRK